MKIIKNVSIPSRKRPLRQRVRMPDDRMTFSRSLFMRLFLLSLLFLPVTALAEDFTRSSDITAVTLYPQGAAIRRETVFDLPAGQHRVILNDLPRATPLEQVRVDLRGATLGAVTGRRDAVPPRTDADRAEIVAARARLESIETRLRSARADIRAIRLEADAAQARIRFLDRLGAGAAQMDVPDLRALSEMIGEDTLTALQQAQAANLRAEDATRNLADLEQARSRAEQALDALLTEDEARAALFIHVSADTATRVRLRVSYVTDTASWTPVYDLRLTRETGALDLERGAFVAQSTGEDWRDVAVTLSTARPTGQTAPGTLYPRGLRIFEEDKLPRPLTMQRSADMAAEATAPQTPMMEASSVTRATARFDGLEVSYDYPAPVTIASGADRTRLSLGTIVLQADLRARAVPMQDDTAFLMAAFTNDGQDVILPTDEASFYLDGRYVGQRPLALIPVGARADLSFGPIDGLRLARRVLERTGGDRGVITRSNELRETLRLEIENLTSETWPVELIDRVPYSEQEDLKIDWRARPAPDERNIDDQRGLLAWRFDLAPGAGQDIRLSKTITWPEGWVLR